MNQADRTLRIPQDRETPVTGEDCPGFTYRYACARAADAQVASDTGQDYLTLRCQNGAFLFAQCDGVSQSFFGNLAARIVGDSLLDWLSQVSPEPMDLEEVQAKLMEHLQQLTVAATEQIQCQSLPAGIPPLLRDVLEEKRTLGSESMFVCGRLDLPSPTLPAGRVLLAWLGDSRLRIWGPAADPLATNPIGAPGDAPERTAELGDTFKTRQRWSTRRGCVHGQPHFLQQPLLVAGRLQVTRLLVYSDGLAVLDETQTILPDVAIQDLIQAQATQPVSDDISFLEIWVGGLPPILASPGPQTVGTPVAEPFFSLRRPMLVGLGIVLLAALVALALRRKGIQRSAISGQPETDRP